MADAIVYASGLRELARINPETADLRVMLVQPSYRVDPVAHQVVDDETRAAPRAHELTVEAYARQPLGGAHLVSTAEGGLYLDALDVPFGALGPGERIGGAVLFREAGSDRLSPLIAFYPLGREGTTGGLVSVLWAAEVAGRVLRWPLPA